MTVSALPTGANICPICHLFLRPGVWPRGGVGRSYCAVPFMADTATSEQPPTPSDRLLGPDMP